MLIVNKNLKNAIDVRTLSLSLIIAMAIPFLGGYAYFNRPVDFGPQLASPPADAIYRLADQPIEARVDDLVSRMTLEEKIGQMILVDKNELNGKLDDVTKYRMGAILSGAGAKPENNTVEGWIELTNSFKQAGSDTRLGIPIFYGIDAIHGHANLPEATIFPHNIGLGAANDTELTQDIALATAQELDATGINWTYSPTLDAPKDIRWGRVYESFTDSPDINGTLGASYIRGISSLKSATGISTTAKHYLGAGSMRWGTSPHKNYSIDHGSIEPNEETLATQYLPPFEAAIKANVSSIMVGLGNWGDERIIDSNYLIEQKLKRDLGFGGFVVSDWYGMYEYSDTSKYDSNVKAINAGVDMAMLPFDYKNFLRDVRKAVEKNDISESRINDAVSRILTKKFEAGLFDSSVLKEKGDVIGTSANKKLAREAVSKSAVLLKNQSVLPVANDVRSIAVAGSGADNVGRQSGAWTVEWQGIDGNWLPNSSSILAGIREKAPDGTEVMFNQTGEFTTQADLGIVVISEDPYAEGFGDDPAPQISDSDLEAIRNTKNSSDTILVILLSGRPLLIADDIDKWDAAIAGWLPGTQGGGIADLIFGDTAFSGKLPIHWPASIEQLPIQTDGSTSDGSDLLFKRGFGL